MNLLNIKPNIYKTLNITGGYDICVLDWAENEIVDLPLYKDGMEDGRTVILPNTSGGPRPKDCLSDAQIELFRHFARATGQASIVGIHAPVVGPWSHWFDDGLKNGTIRIVQSKDGKLVPVENKKLPKGIAVEEKQLGGKDAGKTTRYTEHPALVLRHEQYEPFAQIADYGAIVPHREWLLTALRNAGTDLVLSGHIHRRNLLVVEKLADGAQVIRNVPDADISTAPKPLFVNTTSAGPRGHDKATFGVSGRVDSAYAEIVITNTGKVASIEHVDVNAAGQPLPKAVPVSKLPVRLTF
jgi:hypothetical protein